MPNQFQLSIPTGNGSPKVLKIDVGDVFYMLGANGSGKSSLVSYVFNQNQGHVKRISAHRQTWIESNAVDVTPRSRQDLETNLRSFDLQPRARYWEWNPSVRSNIAIFDLVDADTMQERKIAALVRAGDDVTAKKEAMDPSPIQVINQGCSTLPTERH